MFSSKKESTMRNLWRCLENSRQGVRSTLQTCMTSLSSNKGSMYIDKTLQRIQRMLLLHAISKMWTFQCNRDCSWTLISLTKKTIYDKRTKSIHLKNFQRNTKRTFKTFLAIDSISNRRNQHDRWIISLPPKSWIKLSIAFSIAWTRYLH